MAWSNWGGGGGGGGGVRPWHEADGSLSDHGMKQVPRKLGVCQTMAWSIQGFVKRFKEMGDLSDHNIKQMGGLSDHGMKHISRKLGVYQTMAWSKFQGNVQAPFCIVSGFFSQPEVHCFHWLSARHDGQCVELANRQQSRLKQSLLQGEFL